MLSSSTPERQHARRRALRAAQVATIALALGMGGCPTSREGPPDAFHDATDDAVNVDGHYDATEDTHADVTADAVADASNDGNEGDAPIDAHSDASDAYVDASDGGSDAADAVADSSCTWPATTPECCAELNDEGGGWCEWDSVYEECFCAVPGPFVPPAMIA